MKAQVAAERRSLVSIDGFRQGSVRVSMLVIFSLLACGPPKGPAPTLAPIAVPIVDAGAADATVIEAIDANTGGAQFMSLSGTADIPSGFDEADLAEEEPPRPDASWGTIGTGIYGEKSVVRLGMPTVSDGYDANAVRAAIKQRFAEIKACYEAHLARTPDLAGAVAITFAIGRDGKVHSVVASGLDRVDACLAAMLRRIKFPRQANGGTVSYWWTFAPAHSPER